MGREIERKFLLIDESWRDGAPEGTRMSQGYLSKSHGRTVRVRVAGEQAWLTVKGAGEGISRSEFEYAIPAADAWEMLALCELSIIEKTRYRIPLGQHIWEVDVFHGENEGLVVAEVELGDELETPEMPPWIGEEVSEDRRYANSNLSKTPFKDW